MDSDQQSQTEACPVCGKSNWPGSDEVCEHLVGSVWDGDVIWNDCEEFTETFDELKEQFAGYSNDGKWDRKVAAVCRQLKFDPSLLGATCTSADCLTGMADFLRGKSVHTDGLLGGDGYTIYHSDPDVVKKLTAKLLHIGRTLNSG